MLVLDARNYILKEEALGQGGINKDASKLNLQQIEEVQSQVSDELNQHFHEKPAIVLTGAHHAREHITI